jgi:Flp pilus assembly protein TadG
VTVLIVPVVVATILLGVQFALAYHARQIAEAAAADGAHAAAAYQAPPDAALSTVEEIIEANADGLLDEVAVTVDATAETVTVHVEGVVAKVVPGDVVYFRVTTEPLNGKKPLVDIPDSETARRMIEATTKVGE